MKLLMVTPYLATTYGGTSKSVQELASSLGKLELSIDLVTTNANGTSTLDVPLQSWRASDTYRTRYFSCWHRRDFILSPALTKWLIIHLKGYDCVHTHTVFSPIISFTHWLCKLYKIPYIATPHGMLEPWALKYKAKKKRIYFDWIEKPGLQNASAVQVIATPEADHLQALGFNQTLLVQNGLREKEYRVLPDAELFYQRFPNTRGKPIILFLGRIDPKKGLDLLAPAFATARLRFPESHLVVAGPDSIGFMSTAKKYFEEAGCLDAVTFTGMLTGEVKQAALTAASVYVAPSYSEGFSMSILEGMASGLPCVITSACNFPEAAAAKAAYVVDVDSQSIGSALLQCLNDTADAKALGDRAKTFILENYTWEQSAGKMIKAYESITKSSVLSDLSTTVVEPI